MFFWFGATLSLSNGESQGLEKSDYLFRLYRENAVKLDSSRFSEFSHSFLLSTVLGKWVYIRSSGLSMFFVIICQSFFH